MVRKRGRPKKLAESQSSAMDVGGGGIRKNLMPKGTSGTEINGGYFSEEYLSKLQGERGADIWDEMRRSESQVRMVLTAAVNLLKAATWEFEPAKGVADGEKHAAFVEHIFKERIDWDQFMQEVFTLLPFGFSAFEQVHELVQNDPKFGTFFCTNSLSFRAQKTITRWNVEQGTGKLLSVDQQVVGDVAKNTVVSMPAETLVIFTNEKEGDNYEGISVLRGMYGAWIRKQLYLKLAAIGVEKYALGVVIGKVPSGKENSDELNKYKLMLETYTSHESAYLIFPEGWEITLQKHDFDAEKIKSLILLENTEMINAMVANFLALGTNGAGGSYNLGEGLTKFFVLALKAYANIVCGKFNREILPKEIKMNFGPQLGYPKLKASGIDDNAGTALADIVQKLKAANAITTDDELESHLRKRFMLPQRTPGSAPLEATQAAAPSGPMQFSERRLSDSWKKTFNKNKDVASELMRESLTEIYAKMKDKLRTAYNAAPESGKVKVAANMGDAPGKADYYSKLKELFAQFAFEAREGAKKELSPAVRKQLSETRRLAAYDPKKGYFDALPTHVKKQVEAQASLVADSQVADLEKATYFQFTSSATSTDDINVILNDVDEKVVPTLEGTSNKAMSIEVAAADAIAHVMGSSRMALFFEPDVAASIESFTFVNEDPVSPICQALEGTVFAVSDPDVDRYGPPLHHNCKSRLVPNMVGDESNPEIDRGGVPLTKTELKSITLAECSKIFTVD